MDSLSPVTSAIIETIVVAVLAIGGAVIGWLFSRIRSRLWLLGYVIPLIFIVAASIPRWIPSTEYMFPFSWVTAGRREYVILGTMCSMLLVTPLSRLGSLSQKIAVGLFAVLFCVYFSLLPFIMPALNYEELSKLKTKVNRGGVCLQSTDYTCGPAATVTALRAMGIKAEEGPLAIAARTNSLSGTPPDLLCRAIEKTYGLTTCQIRLRSIRDLRSLEPAVAPVKFAVFVDHFVAVLSVTERHIIIGDPLFGKTRLSHEHFKEQWRNSAIIFDSAGQRIGTKVTQ